jgi:hypothetical protein
VERLGHVCQNQTSPVAFADGLIIGTRGESARAVENCVNGELSKIHALSKFNDKKSKAMLVSRTNSDEILRNNSGPQV